MRKYFFILIVIILLSSVQAEILERAVVIKDEIQANYSIKGDIEIIEKDIGVGSAEARRYPFIGNRIILDSERIENIEEDELKGLLAHELAHLESYSEMNWLQLLIFALRYTGSEEYRIWVERDTDRVAIERGFGQELLEYREYRIADSSGEELDFLEKYYLSPEDIRDLIKFIKN